MQKKKKTEQYPVRSRWLDNSTPWLLLSQCWNLPFPSLPQSCSVNSWAIFDAMMNYLLNFFDTSFCCNSGQFGKKNQRLLPMETPWFSVLMQPQADYQDQFFCLDFHVKKGFTQTDQPNKSSFLMHGYSVNLFMALRFHLVLTVRSDSLRPLSS